MNPLAASPALSDRMGFEASADLYTRVRQREGRLYSDQIASRLPDFPTGHELKNEWLARADSAQRLNRYLADLPSPLHILDLGCGNGWLSHHIAAIPGTKVYGMDRPGPEAAQASRLFGAGNTVFLVANIFHAPFAVSSFDVVILASVIQYFCDLPMLVRTLLPLLRPTGELHVLDSPFYSPHDLDAARERTAAYYTGLGYPEMSRAYFHHTYSVLDQFQPDYLYRPHSLPASLSRQLGRVASPFPWARIRRAV